MTDLLATDADLLNPGEPPLRAVEKFEVDAGFSRLVGEYIDPEDQNRTVSEGDEERKKRLRERGLTLGRRDRPCFLGPGTSWICALDSAL